MTTGITVKSRPDSGILNNDRNYQKKKISTIKDVKIWVSWV